MKRKILLVVILCVAAVLFLYLAEFSRPNRDCKIAELLLNTEDLPAGTIVNEFMIPFPDSTSESGGSDGSYNERGFLHQIVRYRNSDDAKSEYDDYSSLQIVGNNEVLLKIPELDFGSSYVDEYKTICKKNELGEMCLIDMRYDEYYVSFRAYIGKPGFTLQDFINAVRAIDRKMEQCYTGE